MKTGSDKPKTENCSGEVLACMNCGSNNITGVVAASDVRYCGPKHTDPRQRCRDCEYFGVPIVLDSEEERLKYAEFRKKRKHDIPYIFEDATTKKKQPWFLRHLSLEAAIAFFIIGLLYMMQHEFGMGFAFYLSSAFFLILEINSLRKTL